MAISQRKAIILFVAFSLIPFTILFLPRATAQSNLSIDFIGDPSCSLCQEREAIVNAFVSQHPAIQVTYNLTNYDANATAQQDLQDYFAQFGVQNPVIPVAVLNNSGDINILYNDQITTDNLNAWLAGTLTTGAIPPLSFGIVILSGVVVGVSSCVLLILSLLGTSVASMGDRKNYFAISCGLVCGLLSTYVALSLVYLALIDSLTILTDLRYLFGAFLLIIGVWQIIDFRNEHSIIFGTPQKVKSTLQMFIDKRSGWAAFLLGVLFAFVKIPCFGGYFLAILFAVRQSPLLFYYIITYYASMLIPVIILLIALRLGLQSEKLNAARIKYRPYLRLLSGILLIVLTLIIIFFPSS
jgi:cytochrome c biogenesis protein CcdA